MTLTCNYNSNICQLLCTEPVFQLIKAFLQVCGILIMGQIFYLSTQLRIILSNFVVDGVKIPNNDCGSDKPASFHGR